MRYSYIQCSKCYSLTLKDALSHCPECHTRINRKRPDNYYKGSYNYVEVDTSLAKILFNTKKSVYDRF